MEKRIIKEKAMKFLNNGGFRDTTDTYVDIVMLAKSVGFKVGETTKLSEHEDGFISISKDKKNLIIGVNNERSFEEKRFIVAHELAHYFLHYIDTDLNETIMHRENIKGKNEEENDADFMAACLLMPNSAFKREYNALASKKLDTYTIIDQLQKIFKTPIESIERYIKEVC